MDRHGRPEVLMVFFFLTLLFARQKTLIYASATSNPDSLTEVSLESLPVFFFPAVPSVVASLDVIVSNAATCFTNLTMSLESFQNLDTTKFGSDICSVAGDQCSSMTYVSVTQKIVTVQQPSVTPGISSPSSVQKILSVYLYNMVSPNRTVALSRVLAAVRYASPLRQYEVQGVTVNGIAKVYSRVADPITTYIGNSQQCLPHYWYLVFFITLGPLLGAGYHYYVVLLKDRKKIQQLQTAQRAIYENAGVSPGISNAGFMVPNLAGVGLSEVGKSLNTTSQ